MRTLSFSWLALFALSACSSSTPDTQAQPSGGVGGTPSNPGGVSGAAGSGVGGHAGTPPGMLGAGQAGTGPGTAGAGGSGGSSPQGGSAGTPSPSAGSNTGGTSGGSGPSTGGSAGSGAPTAGSAGVPNNPNLKGGASAAFVCAPGATYGSPLDGMGAVTSINPPTMGDVTYFAFIEGPIWVAKEGKLFFSDNASSPNERIWVVTPPSTTPAVFMNASGSNGLAIDNEDNLLLADQRELRITRVDPGAASPTSQAIASTGSAKPNDLIMRSDGNIYFTDPNTARGVYRVSPEGMLSGPVAQELAQAPNGLALSLDERTLYVGDVQSSKLFAFPVAADGTVDPNGTLFATATNSTLDGLALDCAGNVYGGTSNGVEVFSPQGEKLGVVPTGESSNATFGGADRKTLYVTSRATLKAVTLGVPGLPN